MRANIFATWGLPTAIILALAAALPIWAGLQAKAGNMNSVVLVVGIVLGGLALVFVFLAAIGRVHHNAAQHKLQKYACRRCGYTPEVEELESDPSFPCPTCGEPMYHEK